MSWRDRASDASMWLDTFVGPECISAASGRVLSGCGAPTFFEVLFPAHVHPRSARGAGLSVPGVRNGCCLGATLWSQNWGHRGNSANEILVPFLGPQRRHRTLPHLIQMCICIRPGLNYYPPPATSEVSAARPRRDRAIVQRGWPLGTHSRSHVPAAPTHTSSTRPPASDPRPFPRAPVRSLVQPAPAPDFPASRRGFPARFGQVFGPRNGATFFGTAIMIYTMGSKTGAAL